MVNNDVTTNEIMEFLRDNMVTKEDAHDFATKKDLENFATKKDLNIQKHEILDALDDKLANLKGDLTVLMRKEDRKLLALIKRLKDKNVLSDQDVEELLSMEPFPQTG